MIIPDTPEEKMDDGLLVKSDAAGAPLPQASAAPQMSRSKGEDPREG